MAAEKTELETREKNRLSNVFTIDKSEIQKNLSKENRKDSLNTSKLLGLKCNNTVK